MQPGTRLGPYEIAGLLGAGGMGQVYRATDTRLKRQVAIKILPPSLAGDDDRLARFQREAEALAALNHPHIAGLYGLEEHAGLSALVMELVDGEDLSERIAHGALPIVEALAIARQVADALEAAHERGVVHRDLKPANIKVRADGTVKVLDFGLAKAAEPGASPQDLTLTAATRSPAVTQAGVLLGTAAYMSPEQARGAAVDKRADIWAFGCVLFEMLTGTRPFAGEQLTEVLASVLAREPDWTQLPSSLSPVLITYLKRCLHKDPRQRVHDIADVRLALDGAFDVAPSPVTPAATVPRRRPGMALTVAALIGAAVAAAGAYGVLRSPEPVAPRVSRFELPSTGANAVTMTDGQRHIAITPDGTRLAYIGNNGAQLFVRALDSLEPTAVYTQYPRGLFISPDSQWIGFSEVAALRKVSASGGPSILITPMDAPTSRGATWGANDAIVFATTNGTTGLQLVSANGGAVSLLTIPDRERGEADHVWPEWLPGQQAVLFTITATTGGLEAARVAVFDLQTRTQKVLFPGSHAIYVTGDDDRAGVGYLVYATPNTLWAVAFDSVRLETRGAPVALLRDVVTTASGDVDAVVAKNGTLAYLAGPSLAEPARTLTWVDRKGVESPLPTPPRAYTHPRLSPDGNRLVLFTADQELDLWLSDLRRPTMTRVTSTPGVDAYPVWMADGRRVVYSSQGASAGNLYIKAVDGVGPEQRLTESPNLQTPTAMTPDGKRLLFTESNPKTRDDVMQITMEDGSHQITPLVQTPFSERNGIVSPNGRWLAYENDESGRFEVYVSPLADVSRGRNVISAGGGVRPLWSPDGSELFYVSPSGSIMGVGVSPGETWNHAPPVIRVADGYATSPGNPGRTYDVSRDGQRFLMIKNERPSAPRRFIVVQNWLEELRRAIP